VRATRKGKIVGRVGLPAKTLTNYNPRKKKRPDQPILGSRDRAENRPLQDFKHGTPKKNARGENDTKETSEKKGYGQAETFFRNEQEKGEKQLSERNKIPGERHSVGKTQ